MTGRGCRVVAVELGAALAAVARRNLARFPAVEVVTAPFEDWPLPKEPFDLVLAATARSMTPSGPDPGLGTGGHGRTTASVPAVRSAGLAS
jgi:protein-L-isoaspartate O-methyltransferase